jgi:hypothetical protein
MPDRQTDTVFLVIPVVVVTVLYFFYFKCLFAILLFILSNFVTEKNTTQ